MRETLSETMQRVKESADLRSWCESNLEANGKTFTCPFCGSGTGPRRTSAFSIHGGKFKCFSCGESGDVYDLAAHVHGIDNTDAGGKREVVNRVAEWAGVDGCPGNGDKAESVQVKSVQDLARPSVVTKKKQPEKDYTEGRERAASYVEECARRLTVTGTMTSKTRHGRAVPRASANTSNLAESRRRWRREASSGTTPPMPRRASRVS